VRREFLLFCGKVWLPQEWWLSLENLFTIGFQQKATS